MSIIDCKNRRTSLTLSDPSSRSSMDTYNFEFLLHWLSRNIPYLTLPYASAMLALYTYYYTVVIPVQVSCSVLWYGVCVVAMVILACDRCRAQVAGTQGVLADHP